MNKIKKIYVNKSDEPTLIAEKIIDTDAGEIVLNIPKFSKIADSLANFHLIKREAEALDKKVIIESVDDKVIELCGISGIEAVNPFFVKSRRQFSDIVIQKSSGSSSKKEKAAKQVSDLEEDRISSKRPLDYARGKQKRRLAFPRLPFKKGLVWAAIGVAVGFGFYEVSVWATLITVLVFLVFWPIERRFIKRFAREEKDSD